jgi:DNA-binding beta-propeller fold protein YncE
MTLSLRIAVERTMVVALVLLNAGQAPARQLLWQTNSAGDDIHIVDVAEQRVVRRLQVGPEPHGIAAPRDARVVFVSLEANARSAGELLWIDPQTYEITERLTVGPEPHAIATTPDGRWVYVPCRDGHYWVVDGVERRVVKKIHTGGRPHNTQASGDGRYMYLSPMGSPQQVTIVDVADDHRVVGHIRFAGSVRPPALSADNLRFFQHVDGINGFQVADIPSRSVVATVTHRRLLGWFSLGKVGWVGSAGFQRCHGLAIRPDQKEIWSACGSAVNVHDITVPDYPEIASIEQADDAYWLTFSPDSALAFVALSGIGQVAFVDTAGKAVVKRVDVGKYPKRNLVLEVTR